MIIEEYIFSIHIVRELNKMVKVSVLVPFFNSEAQLKSSIDSTLNQTFTDFELILLNDGSTDGSEDVVKSYNDIIKMTKI